jgi:hypothetical protein
MGLWGGAQAVAFALGGFLGTVGVDVTRFLYGSTVLSYAMVFAVEATLFIAAALIAFRLEDAEAGAILAEALNHYCAANQVQRIDIFDPVLMQAYQETFGFRQRNFYRKEVQRLFYVHQTLKQKIDPDKLHFSPGDGDIIFTL